MPIKVDDDAESMAALNTRFTPQRVDLNLHSGSHTLTYLLDGRYYTVKCIRPDFPKVDDDATLMLPPSSTAAAAQLGARQDELQASGGPANCERNLIHDLRIKKTLVFGPAFRAYLSERQLSDVEPTNKSYYEALKTFTTAWVRLAGMISGD